MARLKDTIAECDRKLAQHRAALEAGADAALVTEWMNETQAQRSAAQVKLDRNDQPARRMSKEDIMTIVDALGNIAHVLNHADPADKAEVYSGLGLRLRYQPVENTVRAEVSLDPHQVNNHSRGGWFVSEGCSARNSYTPSARRAFTNACARLSAELTLAGR